MGLDYATNGTMMVAGRKLVVIEKDSQTKPDVGRNLLNEAYNDDGAEIAVGGTSSGGRAGDAAGGRRTTKKSSSSSRRSPTRSPATSGTATSSAPAAIRRQDAISNALAIGKPGTVVATLAQDYAFGRDGVTAFKTALAPTGAKLVDEEYAPPATTDFTAPYQRIFDALAKEQGHKVIFVIWAGGNPMGALKAMDPARLDISVATGGNILPALHRLQGFPRLEGAAYYYYDIPKNPVNDWLIAENKKRFNG